MPRLQLWNIGGARQVELRPHAGQVVRKPTTPDLAAMCWLDRNSGIMHLPKLTTESRRPGVIDRATVVALSPRNVDVFTTVLESLQKENPTYISVRDGEAIVGRRIVLPTLDATQLTWHALRMPWGHQELLYLPNDSVLAMGRSGGGDNPLYPTVAWQLRATLMEGKQFLRWDLTVREREPIQAILGGFTAQGYAPLTLETMVSLARPLDAALASLLRGAPPPTLEIREQRSRTVQRLRDHSVHYSRVPQGAYLVDEGGDPYIHHKVWVDEVESYDQLTEKPLDFSSRSATSGAEWEPRGVLTSLRIVHNIGGNQPQPGYVVGFRPQESLFRIAALQNVFGPFPLPAPDRPTHQRRRDLSRSDPFSRRRLSLTP